MNKNDSLNKILKTAKNEFLDKGFKSSSLRDIAKKSGLTTGAIYGYFPDKETLFDTIVKKEADFLINSFSKMQKEFEDMPVEKQLLSMGSTSETGMIKLSEYLHDNSDIFNIIIFKSAGTKYENYVEKLIKIEEDCTYNFVNNLIFYGYDVKTPDKMLVHILINSLLYGVFEVVQHNIEKQKAMEYAINIQNFYCAGWEKLLNINQTDK